MYSGNSWYAYVLFEFPLVYALLGGPLTAAGLDCMRCLRWQHKQKIRKTYVQTILPCARALCEWGICVVRSRYHRKLPQRATIESSGSLYSRRMVCFQTNDVTCRRCREDALVSRHPDRRTDQCCYHSVHGNIGDVTPSEHFTSALDTAIERSAFYVRPLWNTERHDNSLCRVYVHPNRISPPYLSGFFRNCSRLYSLIGIETNVLEFFKVSSKSSWEPNTYFLLICRSGRRN